MLFEHGVFHYDRFLIKFSVGTIPHDRMMHCIELFGTKVAPAVRTATEETRKGQEGRKEHAPA